MNPSVVGSGAETRMGLSSYENKPPELPSVQYPFEGQEGAGAHAEASPTGGVGGVRVSEVGF